MLRLNTHYDIYHLTTPKVLKILSIDELIAKGLSSCVGNTDLSNILLLLNQATLNKFHSFTTMPIAGFISNESIFHHINDYKGAILTNPRHKEVVNTGDVIAVDPATSIVQVLYRRGSNSNLFFITDRCNSHCLMCSQPPKEVNDEWHIAENLQLIDLMDKGGEQIGISGGEPTLYAQGLLQIINKANQLIPEKSLHILSNGRNLKDTHWINSLQKIAHPNLIWGIPLYADTPKEHDYIVQTKGAFSESIQGIYNLATAEQRVEIRVVLSKLTISRLPQLAYYIFRNMPFVCHVALMGIESTGLARKNKDQLWIDSADYQLLLKEACFYLYNRGIPVSVYNLPLCILDKSLIPFYQKSISDWKNQYIPICNNCEAQIDCGGFFKSHSDLWQSKKISPIIKLN